MPEKNGELSIALNAAKQQGRKYAAKRAIRLIRLDVKKHFRVPVEKILVGREVNEAVWKNGSYNVPKRIRIEVLKEKDGARVFLKGGKEKEAFLSKQKQKERKSEKAKEKETKKTVEEKKEEALEKEEQEKKLEEKRLKESAAQKAEFK
jgi:ribosomal protein L31E